MKHLTLRQVKTWCNKDYVEVVANLSKLQRLVLEDCTISKVGLSKILYDRRQSQFQLVLGALPAVDGDGLFALIQEAERYNVHLEILPTNDCINDLAAHEWQVWIEEAVKADAAQIVRLLLTYQPASTNVNHCYANGDTLLHIAAKKGNREIIKLLCMHGSNKGMLDRGKRTPEQLAKLYAHSFEVISLLKPIPFNHAALGLLSHRSQVEYKETAEDAILKVPLENEKMLGGLCLLM